MRYIYFLFIAMSSLAMARSPFRSFKDTKSGWNSDSLVLTYFYHSELQRQWAWELLGTHRFSGEEAVLDFGCGDGKVSAEIARLVPQGSVTGVDLSAEMIHFAQMKFPPYAYPNLDFRKSPSLTFGDAPEEPFYDLICSFCVFHLVAHPEQILLRFKSCLKPGGKLLFVVPAGISPALHQAANEMFLKYQIETPWKNQSAVPPPAKTSRGLDSPFG